MNTVTWRRRKDASDNTFFEAFSPLYLDDFYLWRLRKKLVSDKVVWVNDSDEEIVGTSRGDIYPSLQAGKSQIKKMHQALNKEISESVDEKQTKGMGV